MTIVHNLTSWIWKIMSSHVACSMKKTESSKMTSYGPSNFEGDKLHLNLLKKPQISGSRSFVIHITYYGNCQLSNICGMTEMVMKQFFLVNVVRLTSNFL